MTHTIEIIQYSEKEHGFILEWFFDLGHVDDFFLAHAVDGVIWGVETESELRISINFDHFHDLWDNNMIQEERLFNKNHEVYLWRSENSYMVRIIRDIDKNTTDTIDEQHILWGVSAKKANDLLFTQLEDGAQGLNHIVPMDATWVDNKKRRLCLNVRHYFGEDDNGVNYIAYSRLMGLEEYQDGEK